MYERTHFASHAKSIARNPPERIKQERVCTWKQTRRHDLHNLKIMQAQLNLEVIHEHDVSQPIAES